MPEAQRTRKGHFEMVKRAASIDMPHLALDRGDRATLPRQIALQLEQAIACGRLPVGARLPATRRLAECLGVSRNTVYDAYEDLLAAGVITGRVGAGSYVVRGMQRLSFADPDGNPLILRTRRSS